MAAFKLRDSISKDILTDVSFLESILNNLTTQYKSIKVVNKEKRELKNRIETIKEQLNRLNQGGLKWN